jgi:hypothetical protein
VASSTAVTLPKRLPTPRSAMFMPVASVPSSK